MTSGFDLGHDLDLEFSRSNIEFAISQPKMVRLPRNEKQTYWLNSRPQMWPMVWIYQIVTGVTSVVGVPSTHLVGSGNGFYHANWTGPYGTNFSEIWIGIPAFKISAGPQTLTDKISLAPASFPSLSYINFGKIMLWSSKFQILFWRLEFLNFDSRKCVWNVIWNAAAILPWSS